MEKEKEVLSLTENPMMTVRKKILDFSECFFITVTNMG